MVSKSLSNVFPFFGEEEDKDEDEIFDALLDLSMPSVT